MLYILCVTLCFLCVFQDGVFYLSDEEVCLLVDTKNIPLHQLEKMLKDPQRAVSIR